MGDAMRLVSQVPLLVPPWWVLGGTITRGFPSSKQNQTLPLCRHGNVGCKSTAGERTLIGAMPGARGSLDREK